MELRDYPRSLYDNFSISFYLGIYGLLNTDLRMNKWVVLEHKRSIAYSSAF